jgi:hypothetical protein
LGAALGYYGTAAILEFAEATISWGDWLAFGLAILLGIVGAVLGIKCIPVGFFVTGALCFFWLGYLLDQVLAANMLYYPRAWAFWVCVCGAALIGGMIGVCCGKYFVMFSTAFAGANQIMLGVAMFFFSLVLVPGSEPCGEPGRWWEVWVYLAGTLILGIVGFITQVKCFADYDTADERGRYAVAGRGGGPKGGIDPWRHK